MNNLFEIIKHFLRSDVLIFKSKKSQMKAKVKNEKYVKVKRKQKQNKNIYFHQKLQI